MSVVSWVKLHPAGKRRWQCHQAQGACPDRGVQPGGGGVHRGSAVTQSTRAQDSVCLQTEACALSCQGLCPGWQGEHPGLGTRRCLFRLQKGEHVPSSPQWLLLRGSGPHPGTWSQQHPERPQPLSSQVQAWNQRAVACPGSCRGAGSGVDCQAHTRPSASPCVPWLLRPCPDQGSCSACLSGRL